jgi:hypothetical protein
VTMSLIPTAAPPPASSRQHAPAVRFAAVVDSREPEPCRGGDSAAIARGGASAADQRTDLYGRPAPAGRAVTTAVATLAAAANGRASLAATSGLSLPLPLPLSLSLSRSARAGLSDVVNDAPIPAAVR